MQTGANNRRLRIAVARFARDVIKKAGIERGIASGDACAKKKEASMASQIVMDHTGDTRHEFDPSDRDALAAAERRFQELTGLGFTAAKRLADGKSELVRSFDPTAEETVFIPRLRGG
jgi:hypothetical protein